MADWTRLLDGKVVFITGAAGAIGSAIARTCLSHGARVVLADVNREALQAVRTTITNDEEQWMIVELDVTNEEAIGQAVQAVVDRWKTIDVLVNK